MENTSDTQRLLDLIVFISCRFAIYQPLSIWLGIQFRQRYFFLVFLAWHDPETQGVQELILDLFKVHLLLTYGWKSV